MISKKKISENKISKNKEVKKQTKPGKVDDSKMQSDVIQSISAFKKIAFTLSERFNVKEICDQVVKILADELGMEYCSIMLIDENNETVVNQSGAVPASESTKKIFLNRAFKIGEGVAGIVAKTNQPILIKDVEKDHRFLKLQSSINIRSLLCLPMYSKGKVLGVMNLSHPRKGFFSVNHETVFSILATIVGQLITFANLQKELETLNKSLEQKVMERTLEIKKSYEILIQTEKLASLGTLISGIAHELNNKLVPILAYSELLQKQSADEKHQNFVGSIHRSALGAKYIVESLLRFSRQEKPQRSYLNLNDVIMDAITILKYRLQQENNELILNLKSNLPITLIDRHQMEQVFINIINNACEAMIGEGGKLTINSFQENEKIIIEINDNGIGIPKENIGKIFDPFFTNKERGKGTGLGLSLCYGIINEHGGEISVRSETSDTTFRISIPIVKEGAHNKPSPVEASKEFKEDEETIKNKKRLLIVDDERYQLELLHEILNNEYDILLAGGGEEAIEILKNNDFDLIISDVKMPGIDGINLFEWIKKNKSSMMKRFLIMTGNILESRVKKLLEESGDRFITKPYKVNDLLSKVRKLTH